MSLDYPILPICHTAESFGNILSAMGPYQDSLSRKSTLFGPNTRPEIPIRFGYCAIPCIGGLCEERLPCSVYLSFPLFLFWSFRLFDLSDYSGKGVLRKPDFCDIAYDSYELTMIMAKPKLSA